MCVTLKVRTSNRSRGVAVAVAKSRPVSLKAVATHSGVLSASYRYTNSLLYSTSSLLYSTSSLLYSTSSLLYSTSSLLYSTSSLLYLTNSCLYSSLSSRAVAMSRKTTSGGHFVKFRKLALTTATSISCSSAWTNELAKSTIDEWFDIIQVFVPHEVYAAFDTPERPSFEALKKLPFFPDENGVYLDTLKTPSGNHVYPGAAPHQTAKARVGFHDSPGALVQNPHSTYYSIKHSITTPCESQFVTLVRIPIPPNLDPEEKALRRLLCRLAEAMFAYWLCAFESTGKGSGLAVVASKLSREMYGDDLFEWEGTLTHSPLMEQLGTQSYGAARQNRFQEHLGALNELYVENPPQNMVDQAWKRSRLDNASQNAGRDRRRNNWSADQVATEKAKDKARKVKRKSKETSESKKETSAYQASYRTNMLKEMNENELEEFKEKNKMKMRKSRAKRKAQKDAVASGNTGPTATTTYHDGKGTLDGATPPTKPPLAAPQIALPSFAVTTPPQTVTMPTLLSRRLSTFPNSAEVERPARRQRSSIATPQKTIELVLSSDSESESSESDSLDGFIVDDDIEE
jgi:hypothetical protein